MLLKYGFLILVLGFSVLLGCVFLSETSQLAPVSSLEKPKLLQNKTLPPSTQEIEQNEIQNGTSTQDEKPEVNTSKPEVPSQNLSPNLTLEFPKSIENNCIGFLIGTPEEAENIALVGGGWARPHPGPFVWGFVEIVQGPYDFSRTDKYVKTAQENNISILATVWPFADWDRQDYPDCKITYADIFYPKGGFEGLPLFRCKPLNMNLYKKFLSALVERYDGDGINDMPGLKIPVRYWEVSNEPEMKSESLTFFIGNEDDYVEILKESYSTIKEICQDCKVLQGGAAGDNSETLDFWRKVFKLGGGDYFDIANIHYIGGSDLSTLNVKPFKAVLDEFNIKKPIWVTEAQFKEYGDDVVWSAKGAFDTGAEKIFFVSFEVGGLHPPTIGKYDSRYKEAVGLCK